MTIKIVLMYVKLMKIKIIICLKGRVKETIKINILDYIFPNI